MIEHLRPQDLNCNVFSIDDYDYEDMTIQELLNTFFTKINECVDVSNESLNYLEWLKGQGLRAETIKVLNEWLGNGTLGELIKKEVLEDFEKRISTNETTIQEHTHDIGENLKKINQNIQDIATADQNIQTNLNSINTINSKVSRHDDTIAVFNRRLEGLQKEMANLCLPIGIIVQSYTDSYDPNAIYGKFGQEWGEITGRFLVGKSGDTEFNTTGKLAGELKHTILLSEMPVHRHDGLVWSNGQHITLGSENSHENTRNNYNLSYGQPPQQYDNESYGIKTAYAGDGEPMPILPPYQVVRMWKRIR